MKINRLLSLVALAVSASPAFSALIAYEPFDYAPGVNALAGKSGGSGWATPWSDLTANGATFQASANAGEIMGTGMNYMDDNGAVLVTAGNSAQMDGNAAVAVQFRGIDTSLYAGASTLYISFIGQKIASGLGTPLDSRAVNVAFFSTQTTNVITGGAENISVGHGTNTPTNGPYNWGAFWGGNGGNGQTPGATQTSHYSTVSAQTLAFNVLKIELNANGLNDRFTLYVNPFLEAEGSNLPSTTVIDNVDRGATLEAMIARVRPFGGQTQANGTGILNWDELRIGTTWADVTPVVPVPEPTSGLLGAVAGLGFLGRRRRKA